MNTMPPTITGPGPLNDPPFAVTPFTSCIAAVVCVGVVVVKRSPARGPISIVRSRVRVEAER